jgi:putative addiction module component (TIGR02574 family)
MESKSDEILDAALRLPDAERANLAARLIESLDPGFDEDADDAWRREAEKRLAEHESGKRRTLTWPEARRRIMGQADDATAA